MIQNIHSYIIHINKEKSGDRMSYLKDIYNHEFVQKLTHTIKKEYPSFDAPKCQTLIFREDWEDLALKQRMRRITVSLYETLPSKFNEALTILYKAAPHFTGLSGIIFPDYVEQYGLEHWEESMGALETFTQYSTSEFAVRPFLLLNQERMIEQFLEWSCHPNDHVRRLASEGSRPRLPWGISIPSFKSDPSPILPILHNLIQDESLYVRKSVANNLNDISKTHPALLADTAAKWYGKHHDTDWIIKHAYRTLLKKGDKQALSVFGYEDDESIRLQHFTCSPDRISIGESLSFSFQIHSGKNTKVRAEYAIDYVKARGQRNKKVFKITEIDIHQGETRAYSKTHSFRDLSTRKHYKGVHTITIIINGTPKESLDFIVN